MTGRNGSGSTVVVVAAAAGAPPSPTGMAREGDAFRLELPPESKPEAGRGANNGDVGRRSMGFCKRTKRFLVSCSWFFVEA